MGPSPGCASTTQLSSESRFRRLRQRRRRVAYSAELARRGAAVELVETGIEVDITTESRLADRETVRTAFDLQAALRRKAQQEARKSAQDRGRAEAKVSTDHYNEYSKQLMGSTPEEPFRFSMIPAESLEEMLPAHENALRKYSIKQSEDEEQRLAFRHPGIRQ